MNTDNNVRRIYLQNCTNNWGWEIARLAIKDSDFASNRNVAYLVNSQLYVGCAKF